MARPTPRTVKPKATASFKQYIEYYLKRRNWSQNRLAICARLNQPQINKMINGRKNNMNIDELVCICLALQLTPKEADDLLARAERALSPASPLHTAYRRLIKIFSDKQIDCFDWETLDEADEYLLIRKLPALPNNNDY